MNSETTFHRMKRIHISCHVMIIAVNMYTIITGKHLENKSVIEKWIPRDALLSAYEKDLS